MLTHYRMKEVVKLVRQYYHSSKIILGGFGTVLPDKALKPFCDYICRGYVIPFLRNLFGQESLERYSHPVIESCLRVFFRNNFIYRYDFCRFRLTQCLQFLLHIQFFQKKTYKIAGNWSEYLWYSEKAFRNKSWRPAYNSGWRVSFRQENGYGIPRMRFKRQKGFLNFLFLPVSSAQPLYAGRASGNGYRRRMNMVRGKPLRIW